MRVTRLNLIAGAFLPFLLAGASQDADSGLGAKIVAFCQQHVGEKVGTGQCASLAGCALEDAGAMGRGPDSPGKEDYTWGEPTLIVLAGKGQVAFANGTPTDLRPGDIIQFRDAKFVHHEGSSYWWKGFPHHTAIVASVQDDTVNVFEENVSGKQFVTHEALCLDELTTGWMRFYHPVPKIVIKHVSRASSGQ